MRSFTISSFIPLHQWWYDEKGVKIVPKNQSMYLTPYCLAIWFMGEGSWARSGYKISTNCFTYKEVSYLTSLLKTLYDLDCTIRNNRNPANKGVDYKHPGMEAERDFFIYIRANSAMKFRELVTPYMTSDMLYKLGPLYIKKT
jgi:LAGLIDADG DNA endonuclease family